MSFGTYNRYLKKYFKSEEIKDGERIIYETFSFKSPNSTEGFNIRTARTIPSYKVPSRFITGLNISNDKPYELFCTNWDKPESGDPFRYDHRPVKRAECDINIGNLGYLDRGEVMRLINMELLK